MKNLILIVAALIIFSGCSKNQAEQQAVTDQLVSFIATGQWKMTSFVAGSTDMTASFSNYKFQFKTDLTVDAILINSGTVDKTGTWNASVTSQTITSNFTNANATLTLLNGIWTVTNTSNSTQVFVQAKQTVGGQLYTLRLDRI